MSEEYCPVCKRFWLYCGCQIQKDSDKMTQEWMNEFREMVSMMKDFRDALKEQTKALKEFQEELKKKDDNV